jgi:hypothetical protein
MATPTTCSTMPKLKDFRIVHQKIITHSTPPLRTKPCEDSPGSCLPPAPPSSPITERLLLDLNNSTSPLLEVDPSLLSRPQQFHTYSISPLSVGSANSSENSYLCSVSSPITANTSSTTNDSDEAKRPNTRESFARLSHNGRYSHKPVLLYVRHGDKLTFNIQTSPTFPNQTGSHGRDVMQDRASWQLSLGSQCPDGGNFTSPPL